MKTIRPILFILLLMLLTSCGFDREEMDQAWAACQAATGEPSGQQVSGKVYELDSIDGGEIFFQIDDDCEYKPCYSRKYISDYYSNFTNDLVDAGSILCIKLTTKYSSTCSFSNTNFTIKYYHTEADLTLLAWPSGELIARVASTDKPFNHTFEEHMARDSQCPTQVVRDTSEKERHVYELIPLIEWLERYVTITK